MGTYILKRLLLAIPTLLGITVITFCLIRLAPGDPVSSEETGASDPYLQRLTPERLERTRRLYGLDLPLLLNFDVKDRRRTVLAAWEEASALIDKGAPDEALVEVRDRLLSLKKRLTPYLAPLAVDAGKSRKGVFLRNLLREGAGIESSSSTDASSAEAFAAWWAGAEGAYRETAVIEAADRFAIATDTEAEALGKDLEETFGALALPRIMERIETLSDGPALRRLTAWAAPYGGYDRPLPPDADPSRYATARNFLASWWDREGLAFREIGGGERLLRAFTEAQYPRWLGRILTLDFGTSFSDHRPVGEKVREAFAVTVTFQVIVIFLVYLIAVPLGIFSAVKKGSLSDRFVTGVLFVLYSLPSFWVAYMLILLFGKGSLADVFPIQGLNTLGAENWGFWARLGDRLLHMVLPVACMAYGSLAVLSRYARSGMIEVVRQDYIRTARAKGLSGKAVILRHALRNGLIPIITLVGGILPALISGSVIIETIFNIPGMGRLGFHAVLERDYPVVMAIALFSAVLVLAGMLLSDLLYAVADPRIRYRGRA